MLKIILFVLLSVSCFGEVHYPTAETIHSEADQIIAVELCKEEVFHQYIDDVKTGEMSNSEYQDLLQECESDAM